MDIVMKWGLAAVDVVVVDVLSVHRHWGWVEWGGGV